MCTAFQQSQRLDAYRLPYCSAFLRLTDKLEDPGSQLISSSYHVPVCVMERLWSSTPENSHIGSALFRSESVTGRVFEELFNANMLGSKWLTYAELERLYEQHNLLDVNERVVIHAQEFSVKD
jgi:hypothetical protein